MTNLDVAPSGNRVPLFLRLQSAPDVQQLVFELKWTPNDLVGPCFFIAPDSTLIASCGWATSGPGGEFEGDSSYTWSIRFPPGADKSCVTYWVEGGACGGKQATFCLGSVKVRDSNGTVDVLTGSGPATILGGTADPCPGLQMSFFPASLPMGTSSELTVVGEGLAQATDLELVGQDGTIPALSIQVLDDRLLTATLNVPENAGHAFDVVLKRSGSQPDLVAGTVTATNTFAILSLQTTSPNDCGIASYAPPADRNPNAQTMYCGHALCPSEFPWWSGRGCKQNNRISDYECIYTIFIDGQPAPAGLPMQLDYSVQPLTGGHGHHDASRPVAYQFTGGNPGIGEMQSITRTTDASGRISFTLVAPEVAGGLTVTVYSTDAAQSFNPQHNPTDYFCFRVPNLNEFVDGMPGLVRHPGGADNLVRHTSFHWARPEVLNILSKVGASWTTKFPATGPLHINDMSLQFGGRFDWEGSVNASHNWGPSHCGHMWGTSVDIPFATIPRARTRLVLAWLNGGRALGAGGLAPDVADRFTAEIHGGNHYHLDF